jgi:hypothetical protein
VAPRFLNPLSRLRSRTRDVTTSLVRPTPLDQRIISNPITRWVARLALATVVVAGGTSLFFFPLMDFVTQRSAIAEKNSEFAALADAKRVRRLPPPRRPRHVR